MPWISIWVVLESYFVLLFNFEMSKNTEYKKSEDNIEMCIRIIIGTGFGILIFANFFNSAIHDSILKFKTPFGTPHVWLCISEWILNDSFFFCNLLCYLPGLSLCFEF